MTFREIKAQRRPSHVVVLEEEHTRMLQSNVNGHGRVVVVPKGLKEGFHVLECTTTLLFPFLHFGYRRHRNGVGVGVVGLPTGGTERVKDKRALE
ncbi:hypothetical protein M0802_000177 [Mischocyttarus mexicanus]|nr:hypothetical protein M0802_000177 [Mischocyttarus mexicanus]